MQLLSAWHFGFVSLLAIVFFGVGYLVSRQVRRFWAWSTGNVPPKEKPVVFLPLSLIVGLIAGGFLQTFYEAGSICQSQGKPLVPCTIKLVGESTS